MRKWIVLIVVLLMVSCLIGWYWNRGEKPVVYQTASVERGDLLATISATGTLEPEEVVDVGAQVAGQLDYFGKDPGQPGKLIDYGSQVDEGTLLAHIDDSLYVADVKNAEAQVAQAQANVQKAQADLGQLNARLSQADNDWKRAQQVGIHAGLSASDLDTYKANYEVAAANLADGQAAVQVAQTGLEASRAALDKFKRTLSYCTINSPVKGTIIDRRMNIGQTVVAALNAPSLFLIAKDLKRMQVWASVNEADIGSIQPGQTVSFSVDAYPGRIFKGVVGKVRLNASMTQNVVTYTVEINTDNEDGKLLPYLTANVQFEMEKRTNVLMVPNAALRWTPLPEQIAPEFRQNDTAPATRPADQLSSAHDRGTIWIQDGNFVRPLKVHIGQSDGVNTEIQTTGLSEGNPIVVGIIEPEDQPGGSKNPFIPQFGGKKK